MGHCVLCAMTPRSGFQFGSGAPQAQQSISEGCVWPLAGRALLSRSRRRCLPVPPPPPPRPLRAPRAGCALRVVRPLSPSFPRFSSRPLTRRLLPRGLFPPALCKVPRVPLARFKVPGGKWGVGEERISGRQIWILRIAAAAAARRPPEAPARCARRPKQEGGSPRLGHRRLRPRLPLHPKDQEPLLG